jgi:hypothetical protein
MKNQKLHPSFDLFYDMKTMSDVEKVARGESHCFNTSIEDVVDMFLSLEIELPNCLSQFKGTQTIWLCSNGTWSKEEPTIEDEESHIFKRTRVNSLF